MSVTNASVDSWNKSMNTSLEVEDPEIYDLIEKEKYRQFSGLELIASENFTSQAVMEANGSALTNKYSEGLPGARYYGGNEYIDEIENLCRARALKAFRLNPEEWGVNDRLMGLDLPSGGHLTHGYQTAKKKISSSSIYFQSMPYQENAKLFRPRLLICGASAYPREWDYARFRKIADQHGAYLMADIAHISGLVASEEAESPFTYCDIVTTTTHKTLRGPRAGLIFFRKNGEGDKADLEARVNQAVFPSNQGGPHNNTIAAVAVALKQAGTPEFRQYAKQVRANATRLGEALAGYGYKIATNGTDNHLILWDLRPVKLTGSKFEKICDMVHITINKNSVHGDVSALTPGGCRIGTAALTSRSFKDDDFVKVAEFLHRAVQIALSAQEKAGSKLLKDFVAVLKTNDDITALRKDVIDFATTFPMPGFDASQIKRFD
ncbi:serine hydroxymethyltransferase [Syncephalis fuscata]|nr:serine hydroxymethyltransferase [Syncephalis fuscata]